MKRIAVLAISIILLFMACGKLPETFKVIYHGGEGTTGFPPVDNKQYTSGEYAAILKLTNSW